MLDLHNREHGRTRGHGQLLGGAGKGGGRDGDTGKGVRDAKKVWEGE